MPLIEPKPVDGMTGNLNYDKELIETLKKEKKKFGIYPVDIIIKTSGLTDSRWKTWKRDYDARENNGKEKTEAKV